MNNYFNNNDDGHGHGDDDDDDDEARIYARAPGARAQGGKFSGAAY